ncbi:male development gene 1 [Hepatocystis sp. ex Piliocolobus tephrosceles]|nr:male development gene 1 [Hepatocystis sp. ex Piliocolobus tephrosceles]
MRNSSFSILSIFCFFNFFLSYQNVYYKCIHTDKLNNNVSNYNSKSNEKSNVLATEWSNKGYNFMDLVLNGYLKNKDLDNIKDQLASELATNIQNKLISYISKQDLSKIGSLDDSDVTYLKEYLKNMTDYIDVKASELLHENIGNAVKQFMVKGSDDNDTEQNLKKNFNINLDQLNDDYLNKETEKIVDELLTEYANDYIEKMDKLTDKIEEKKKINTHNNVI